MAPGPEGALPRPMPITDGNTTRGYLVRLPERMAGLLPTVS
jgi:hypothetical protein